MAYQRIGVCGRFHGANVRGSDRWPARWGLARDRDWTADGDCHHIPQCMVERQIYGSLDREIPETSSEGHSSGIGQHPGICMGIRAMRAFDARASRDPWHQSPHADGLRNCERVV